jgi:hypothetical protein
MQTGYMPTCVCNAMQWQRYRGAGFATSPDAEAEATGLLTEILGGNPFAGGGGASPPQ